MKHVDVEIYLKNIFGFFDKNPDQLKILIGSLDKGKFYKRIENKSVTNYEKNKEPELSKKEIVDLIWELHLEEVKKIKRNPFVQTKYGVVCLN